MSNREISNAIQQLYEIQEKVNKIYELTMKTYMLGLLGKRIGIENKSKNLMGANFLIEKQLRDLYRTLGVMEIKAETFINDKERLAEEVLEYILESYVDVVRELAEDRDNNCNNNSSILTDIGIGEEIENKDTENLDIENKENESEIESTTDWSSLQAFLGM